MNYKKLRKSYLDYKNGYNLDALKGERNINLGCGNKPLPGFVNTDYYNPTFADEVFSLDVDFPFEDASCDLIHSDNVFEHLIDLLGVIDRCYRCLKPGGHLVAIAPYFKSKHAFVDPTHVRFFTIQTLDYFVKGTYFNSQYKFFDNAFSCMRVFLDPGTNTGMKDLVAWYAITRPNHFENSILSSLFVFHNIVFVLRK